MMGGDGTSFQKVLDVLEVEEAMFCAKHRDLKPGTRYFLFELLHKTADGLKDKTG